MTTNKKNHEIDSWQHDIQQNDIQQNDIQQNDIKQNDIKQNDIKQNDIKQNDVQQNAVFLMLYRVESNPRPFVGKVHPFQNCSLTKYLS